MARQRAAAALVAVVLMLVAVGSAGYGHGSGDVLSGLGDGSIVQCVAMIPGSRDVTAGFIAVHNTTNHPVMLTSLRLMGAQNMTLEAAYVLPIPAKSGVYAIGDSASWPPAEDNLSYLPPGTFAAGLAALDGFVVPPTKDASAAGIQGYNIVLHLKVRTVPAGFRGWRIDYVTELGGQRLNQNSELATGFQTNPTSETCGFPPDAQLPGTDG